MIRPMKRHELLVILHIHDSCVFRGRGHAGSAWECRRFTSGCGRSPRSAWSSGRDGPSSELGGHHGVVIGTLRRWGERRNLYPPIEPYESGMLEVGNRNSIFWEACGNPVGKPALAIHGGPGSGSVAGMRRRFNPEVPILGFGCASRARLLTTGVTPRGEPTANCCATSRGSLSALPPACFVRPGIARPR